MKGHFSTISFAGGFLIGALCIGFWTASNDTFPLTASTNAESIPSENTASSTSSGAVSVGNQAFGTTVTIESVTVPPPGVWIAVREVSNATLGNVLGATRVTGPRSAVLISLLRATTPESAYAVELYRDNGDDIFDLSSDSVYVDFSTGEPVVAYFQTTDPLEAQ